MAPYLRTRSAFPLASVTLLALFGANVVNVAALEGDSKLNPVGHYIIIEKARSLPDLDLYAGTDLAFLNRDVEEHVIKTNSSSTTQFSYRLQPGEGASFHLNTLGTWHIYDSKYGSANGNGMAATFNNLRNLYKVSHTIILDEAVETPSPASLEVEAGDIIRFVNGDGGDHLLTHLSDDPQFGDTLDSNTASIRIDTSKLKFPALYLYEDTTTGLRGEFAVGTPSFERSFATEGVIETPACCADRPVNPDLPPPVARSIEVAGEFHDDDGEARGRVVITPELIVAFIIGALLFVTCIICTAAFCFSTLRK